MASLGIQGLQWGDEGKTKVIDFNFERGIVDIYGNNFRDATVDARYQGGANAGHTMVLPNGKKVISHQVPSGITKPGVYNLVFLGAVVEPLLFCGEMEDFEKMGYPVTSDRLGIDGRTHVTLQFHREEDGWKPGLSYGQNDIGTTGKGIGPTYVDWVSRRGVTFAEFLNPDSFRTALRRNLEKSGRNFDIEEYVKMYEQARERLRPFLVNGLDIQRERRDANWLWEGAQGALLDIRSGSYPYVTCSSPTIVPAECSHKVGIAKAYTTRVGEGPFPTELGGKLSAEYCSKGAEHDFFFEVREYLGMDLNLDMVRRLQREKDFENLGKVQKAAEDRVKGSIPQILSLLNSDDPFLQGVGLRLAGDEYGATTRRPRRTGWFDATIVRDAITAGGVDSVFLTKLDVLTGMRELVLCTGYKVDGKEINTPMDRTEWGRIERVEESMAGWDADIRNVRSFGKLPWEARKYVNRLAEVLDCNIEAVSVGPQAEQTIVMK